MSEITEADRETATAPRKRNNTRPIRECIVPGCGPKAIKGRGFCCLHYTRWHKHGDPLWEPPVKPTICGATDCGRRVETAGHCQKHYLRLKKYGDADAHPRYYAPAVCEVDGCEEPTKKRGRHCPMHRGRIERYGVTDLPPRSGRRTNDNGYQVIRLPDHPLAWSEGWVYEHRAVLHDTIGPGEHHCHWCGTPVSWDRTYPQHLDALVVDHLDADVQNNDPANLVQSCNPCNVRRADLARWAAYRNEAV